MFEDCPFCNGKAESQHKNCKARIKCSICGIRTSWYDNWYEAEHIWNHRVIAKPTEDNKEE